MGSLKLAKGIGEKILLIDTERGSGDLYANLFDYDVLPITPPYKPEKYIEALHAAEDHGYDVVIVDSLSHAWADEGGLLDQADKLQGKTDRFRVWSNLTPQHRRLVNALLNTPVHLVATMRSKQQYAMDRDESTGKTSVKKHGLAPVQREGMEYEFTVFFDVDQDHNAQATKDRTDLFKNESFIIDQNIGKRLSDWLNAGAEDPHMLYEDMKRLLTAIEAPIPSEEEKDDQRQWLKEFIPQLTGLEWKPEALKDIVVKLHSIVANDQKFEDVVKPKKEKKSGKGLGPKPKGIAPQEEEEEDVTTNTAEEEPSEE